jgi:hypothetical protein
MSRNATVRADTATEEFLDGGPSLTPRPVAVPVEAPTALQSPIMEHRPVRALPPDAMGLTVPLPPIGAFVGPSRIALLVAAPVWLVAGLEVALMAAILALAYRFIHELGDRAGSSFGAGFLPYRARLEWPQGVQEDYDVRWNWSPARTDGPPERPAGQSIGAWPTHQGRPTGRAGGDARPVGAWTGL